MAQQRRQNSLPLPAAPSFLAKQESPSFAVKPLRGAPPLLLEAFVALLSDRYQYPVSEAVKALERVRLPEAMKTSVGIRLWSTVLVYAKTANQQAFLVQVIDAMTMGFLTEDQRAGKAGAAIVSILEFHEVGHYHRELCQPAPNIDPGSACNIDPLRGCLQSPGGEARSHLAERSA